MRPYFAIFDLWCYTSYMRLYIIVISAIRVRSSMNPVSRFISYYIQNSWIKIAESATKFTLWCSVLLAVRLFHIKNAYNVHKSEGFDV